MFNFMVGMNAVTYDYNYSWSQKLQLLDYSNPQFDGFGTQTSAVIPAGIHSLVSLDVSTITLRKDIFLKQTFVMTERLNSPKTFNGAGILLSHSDGG